jgi:hypothetical protein
MQKYKADVTRLIVSQLNTNIWTFETAMKDWWYTSATSDGMRLTDVGDLSFRQAEFEFYEIVMALDRKMSFYQFITELNNKIKCPYYIFTDHARVSKIRLYDSRIAMMITLHGGLFGYLRSIKSSR